ncbi:MULTISPECIES: GH1 family beta-glucosidase [Caproicibacterium]|uniref:Beta-glucosidase n=1 Tax=Caproicibacterium argilliputei TaxID=3030016 RepID=A0AA97H1N1_9FIRM|nr:GH1 family beta-glucosidase [Caproicibacterium argilliputei]WOC32686.1 GH1 family beta-glucosidase [Caproicibacterium argilliputei]
MEPFVFGTATAAYQIEGGVQEGGRGLSIWDTFSRQPGKMKDGATGEVACDYYHRWKDDLALMKQLGIDSYRFSIAWPRIFPQQGVYNPEGMQFYKEILLELRRLGISAAVTLYHWDLPQWAQNLGGWDNRDCAQWFADYAQKCFAELDGLVTLWITHNEPFCASFVSNLEGRHAPGNRDLEKALRAAHHLLLSHGLAVQAYRKMGGRHQIGITLNLAPVYPATASFADGLACAAQDAYQNRWFLEPLFHGQYPQDFCMLLSARCATDFDFVQPGDFAVMQAPLDFLGVNFYTRNVVEFDPTALLLQHPAYTDLPKTEMGWDVCPETLTDLLRSIRTYTKLPVYITENGSAWQDTVTDGAVHDPQRADYLLRHLQVLAQANREGLNVAGYYYWSFLDNLEWARGYSKRFGLVYVDYRTQRRIPKDSFFAYRDFIAAQRGEGCAAYD